jgi:ubiquinone/menaquinone biosynthesis C-methylase UbiE
MKLSTERFSDRVDQYTRYRPSYPPQVIERLTKACGLTAQSRIADIGSGTGILTQLFLDRGCTVYGVEPNLAMRTAAEELLAAHPNFKSVAGTAEQTTLQDRCVDFVTAGQALHWFDAIQARQEFNRILRPGGWVALVWNDKKLDASPFLRDYEQIMQTYANDDTSVKHRSRRIEQLQAFFTPSQFEQITFSNEQILELEELHGRALSSSYAPNIGESGCEDMLQSLARLFDRYQTQGAVHFPYETTLYYGQLG